MTPLSLDWQAAGLAITWAEAPDSPRYLPAPTLRQACRCAHCLVLVQRSASPQNVSLTRVLPVGHYGIQLTFSDGHARGIYPWALLWDLAS